MSDSKCERPNGGEREFEIGKDEAWFANIKRTYDEFQQLSLESARRNRTAVDKIVSDAQSHDNNVRNVSLQALQNAVETANMISKQAVAHRDVAIDHTWNLEPSEGKAQAQVLSEPMISAIQAAVAVAVNRISSE